MEWNLCNNQPIPNRTVFKATKGKGKMDIAGCEAAIHSSYALVGTAICKQFNITTVYICQAVFFVFLISFCMRILAHQLMNC